MASEAKSAAALPPREETDRKMDLAVNVAAIGDRIFRTEGASGIEPEGFEQNRTEQSDEVVGRD